MKIYCPDCGAVVAAEDLNLQTFLARCRACNSVFSFADTARTEIGRGANRLSGVEAAATIPCPPRFRVEDHGASWTASWRWFSPSIIFLVLFCVAWDGFLIFWYTIAFSTNSPWIMKVFPVVHVAVGVSLTYTVIATLFNSTKIQATRSELTVASGPVPWRGNRILPASSVRQFTTLNYRSANNVEGTAGNSSFGLYTVLDDGRTIRLVGGLKDPMEASYLQQQLEKRLNVRPSPF